MLLAFLTLSTPDPTLWMSLPQSSLLQVFSIRWIKLKLFLCFPSFNFKLTLQKALNAPHHIYSYAPHRPTLLRKWMPENDQHITWNWIKSALPTLTEAEAIYDLGNMLSKQSLCTLMSLKMGNPNLQDIVQTLKRDLYKMSKDVKRRGHEYNYLDPDLVACSIDI